MKKAKLIAVLIAAGVISACTPSASTMSNEDYILPYDLHQAGCQLIKIKTSDMDRIYLIKCPEGKTPPGYIGTSTSHSKGKYTAHHSLLVM